MWPWTTNVVSTLHLISFSVEQEHLSLTVLKFFMFILTNLVALAVELKILKEIFSKHVKKGTALARNLAVP